MRINPDNGQVAETGSYAEGVIAGITEAKNIRGLYVALFPYMRKVGTDATDTELAKRMQDKIDTDEEFRAEYGNFAQRRLNELLGKDALPKVDDDTERMESVDSPKASSAGHPQVLTVFAVLAVASSLLNVWFVSGGSQKMAMKNLPLTAQKSQAWNLDDGISFCQDLKSTMASAREAMDNSTRLGKKTQYFDMAAAAYRDAYSSFHDNNCDAMSYMLK